MVNRTGHLLRSIQQQTSLRHFAIFEFWFCRFQLRKFLGPQDFAKSLLTSFDPQTSYGGTFTQFAGTSSCCVSNCNLVSHHLLASWSCQWLDLHAEAQASQPVASCKIYISWSIRFWCQGAVDSHSSFTHKRKRAVTSVKKSGRRLFMVSCDFGLPLPKWDTSHGHRPRWLEGSEWRQ